MCKDSSVGKIGSSNTLALHCFIGWFELRILLVRAVLSAVHPYDIGTFCNRAEVVVAVIFYRQSVYYNFVRTNRTKKRAYGIESSYPKSCRSKFLNVRRIACVRSGMKKIE